MPRAEERIVEQNGVAGPKGVDRMCRERVLDGEGHRAHVTRRVRPLRDHAPLGVEDRHREILTLARLLGVGRPVDRRADLDRDRLERAPDDAEGDRVDPRHGSSTRRFAYSSTDALAPGGSTVVDSRSSTIAGPARRAPPPTRNGPKTGGSPNPGASGKKRGGRPSPPGPRPWAGALGTPFG